jgi:hypothetical protein
VWKQKIRKALKESLEKKKMREVSVLRLLLTALLEKEKEKRVQIVRREKGLGEEELREKSRLSPEEMIGVVSSEVKKREAAIEGFEKGGRNDLAEKEREEIEILKTYLPKPLSEKELNELAKEAVKRAGAEGIEDLGRVMGELMPRIRGRAGGAEAARVVKELLSRGGDYD